MADWITSDGNLTQKNMEHNAAIWIPILRDYGVVDPAITALLSWSDYVATLNPERQRDDPLGLLTPVGLLGWYFKDIAGQYPGNTAWKNGDNQVQFFFYTVEHEENYWLKNEDASPVNPPITLQEWIKYDGKDMEMFLWITFGWYYMHDELSYYTRKELELRSDFWKVFVAETEGGGGGKKQKKGNWIYYLKPFYRR